MYCQKSTSLIVKKFKINQLETKSVLIVGLGGISFGYNKRLNETENVLTHSHAFSIHPNFQIIAGVDLDENKRIDFGNTFQCKTYSKIENALLELNPEIIVVATPTESHCEIIKKIIKIRKPSVIICEKPLAYSLKEADEIVQNCKINNVRLYVNYMRNSSKISIELFKKISNKDILPPFKIIQWYSKGIINSASHFVTLFNFLFGLPINIESLRKNSLENYSKDQNFDFKILYKDVEVYFLSVNHEYYFHNSFELIAQNGRLIYERGGEFVKWFPISNDGIYSGYSILSNIPIDLESDFSTMQFQFVDNLWKNMNGIESSICSGDDAIQTMRTLNKILNTSI